MTWVRKFVLLLAMAAASGLVAGALGGGLSFGLIACVHGFGIVELTIVGTVYGAFLGAICGTPAFLLAGVLAGKRVPLKMLFRFATIVGAVASFASLSILFLSFPSSPWFALVTIGILMTSIAMILSGKCASSAIR